jgi:Cof subfamily protein (haloacid dehalogenase superfamily)
MVSFTEDRFCAIDLFDAPDVLAGIHAGHAAARDVTVFDVGWLWLPVLPNRVTTSLVGTGRVEVVWSGEALVEVRVTDCPMWVRTRPHSGSSIAGDPAAALRGVELVAVDLDGTLLTSAGVVTPRARAAVQRARRGGLRLAFVTGRPLADTVDLLRAADLRGFVAASNGAIVLDEAGRVLHRRVLDSEQAVGAARILGRDFPELVLGAVDESRLLLDPGFPADLAHEWSGQVCAGPVSGALDSGGILKILAAHPHLPAEALAPAVSAALGDGYVLTYSTHRFLEISDARATKGEAVTAVAAAAGVPVTAVAAIGDMPNDLPMLDRSAVAIAVGNADRLVLQAADIVVAGNDHDGVARLLDAVVAARQRPAGSRTEEPA